MGALKLGCCSIKNMGIRLVTLVFLGYLVLAFFYFLQESVAQKVKGVSITRSDDWPQFRGNSKLTGVSTSSLAKFLKLRWTFEAGESIESSAAIVGGVVYVGSQSGHLLAVSLRDGKEIWRYQATEFGIGESSPCVGIGLVYIGDLDGVLHAVHVETGRKAWTFRTEGEIKSSPVVIGDRVLIGSYDSYLYSLDAHSGKLLWKVPTEGYIHTTPSIFQGVAYISGCDEVFRAIGIKNGKELFQVPSIGYTGASPALLGDAAYFGTFGNEVVSVNRRQKRVIWRYEAENSNFPFYSSAAVIGGKVILGGRDKKVYCLKAQTGKPIWIFSTGGRVDSSPVIVENRVYVGSHDGRFYVLDLVNGEKLWEFNAGAPISASPAVAGENIVVGSQDGQLFCFGSNG